MLSLSPLEKHLARRHRCPCEPFLRTGITDTAFGTVEPRGSFVGQGLFAAGNQMLLTLPLPDLGIYKTENFFQKEEKASTNLFSSHLHNFLFWLC